MEEKTKLNAHNDYLNQLAGLNTSYTKMDLKDIKTDDELLGPMLGFTG